MSHPPRFADQPTSTAPRWAGWLAALARRGSLGPGPRYLRLLEQVLDELGPGERHHVLDVGCGGGRLIELLVGVDVLNVAGVDQRPQPLAAAWRRNRVAVEAGRLRLKQSPAHALPWPDKSFSAVVSADPEFVLLRPEQALREALRVLRAGGKLVIVAPQPPLRGASPRGWRPRLTGSTKPVYEDAQLVALARLAGFQELCVSGQAGARLLTAVRPHPGSPPRPRPAHR